MHMSSAVDANGVTFLPENKIACFLTEKESLYKIADEITTNDGSKTTILINNCIAFHQQVCCFAIDEPANIPKTQWNRMISTGVPYSPGSPTHHQAISYDFIPKNGYKMLKPYAAPLNVKM